MGADFRDALVGDDSDAICVLDGRKPVRDHHGGKVVDLVETVEGSLNHLLCRTLYNAGKQAKCEKAAAGAKRHETSEFLDT